MANQMSMFIISIIIASIAVLSIGVFYSGLSNGYGVSNNQNISKYSQLDSINNMTSSLNDKVINQPTSTGGFAILGDFLSYGYNAVVLTFTSYNLFYLMLNNGFDSIPTGSGEATNTILLIKVGIGSIVFIVLIFIIITLLTGRQQI